MKRPRADALSQLPELIVAIRARDANAVDVQILDADGPTRDRLVVVERRLSAGPRTRLAVVNANAVAGVDAFSAASDANNDTRAWRRRIELPRRGCLLERA
jgi:hypothetical protein